MGQHFRLKRLDPKILIARKAHRAPCQDSAPTNYALPFKIITLQWATRKAGSACVLFTFCNSPDGDFAGENTFPRCDSGFHRALGGVYFVRKSVFGEIKSLLDSP